MPSNIFKVTVIQHWLYDSWIDSQGRPCDKDSPGARFVKVRKVNAGTPGAKKVKKKSSKWYGRVPGSSKALPLSTNKVAAQQILAELVRKAELGRAGISDPFEVHRKLPLANHLADWESSLRAGGATGKHVNQTVASARRIIEGCRFIFMTDLSASRVQQYLAELRERRCVLSPLDPARSSYTKAELAELLGIRPPAIAALIRRHQLEASGNGKARRYPKATAEALRSIRSRGRSIKTSNLYLDAIKQFTLWLVQDRRMPDNPLAHLSGGNVKLDRRHDRRTLSPEQLRAIIQAARHSGQEFRGLRGPDRAMLYSVACASGFRASELASLCPNAFALDEELPTVTLAAEHAKNGRTAVQPLPPDVVLALREYLAGRPDDAPVWSGTWPKKAAEMIGLDLEVAGIPYVVDGPDGPLYADFHALRHSYIALLDRSGATLKEAMQLARHSDPKLTMAVYGRAQLHDLGQAVRRLPSLLDAGSPEREAVRATGTELVCAPVCTGFVQTDDIGSNQMQLVETRDSREGENAVGLNSRILQGVEADCDSLRLSEESSPSRTRTYNKPVNRRLAKYNREARNPIRDLSLCQMRRVCNSLRERASARKEVRKFRSSKKVARKIPRNSWTQAI
jgi:integrase